MQFDVFFSVSRTPAFGQFPDEPTMLRNFLAEVEAADALDYGVAWLAESHLSSEVQKRHVGAVVPHWKGEVGLNVDFVQAATRLFSRTRRIEAGSAIMNIVANGGPVAAAERVAALMAWHGLDPKEQRRVHVGFAAGRFDFMNRASGIIPRNAVEAAAWPIVKGLVFREAADVFCRLLRGDTLASVDLPPPSLSRELFRSDADWAAVRDVAGTDEITLDRRWNFDVLKIVPEDWRRELLQLVIGSHEPAQQVRVNEILPVQVFNLSITRPDLIEATHDRMSLAYHPAGGPWRRSYMPRTVMVFLDGTAGLSDHDRRQRARDHASEALGAYWKALEGTLDPAKVAQAADNAVIGTPDDVAEQICTRFHPDDRLMLWFDFFDHDVDRVIRAMTTFHADVVPRVRERLGASR